MNGNRLIGLAFDRFDGLKPESERRPDQKDRCITECPSFLEVLGFSYSFHGLMIGPQYPLSLYRKFIRGELSEKKGEKPAGALSAGLKTGALGIGLLIFSEVAKGLLPGSFMTSKEFHEDYTFLKRLGYVSATGVALMYKVFVSYDDHSMIKIKRILKQSRIHVIQKIFFHFFLFTFGTLS